MHPFLPTLVWAVVFYFQQQASQLEPHPILGEVPKWYCVGTTYNFTWQQLVRPWHRQITTEEPNYTSWVIWLADEVLCFPKPSSCLESTNYPPEVCKPSFPRSYFISQNHHRRGWYWIKASVPEAGAHRSLVGIRVLKAPDLISWKFVLEIFLFPQIRVFISARVCKGNGKQLSVFISKEMYRNGVAFKCVKYCLDVSKPYFWIELWLHGPRAPWFFVNIYPSNTHNRAKPVVFSAWTPQAGFGGGCLRESG